VRHVKIHYVIFFPGLDSNTKLRSLNLACNRVKHVGRGLLHLMYIEELNLAGNQIGSFGDIITLAGACMCVCVCVIMFACMYCRT
jgi:hypothetical protein